MQYLNVLISFMFRFPFYLYNWLYMVSQHWNTSWNMIYVAYMWLCGIDYLKKKTKQYFFKIPGFFLKQKVRKPRNLGFLCKKETSAHLSGNSHADIGCRPIISILHQISRRLWFHQSCSRLFQGAAAELLLWGKEVVLSRFLFFLLRGFIGAFQVQLEQKYLTWEENRMEIYTYETGSSMFGVRTFTLHKCFCNCPMSNQWMQLFHLAHRHRCQMTSTHTPYSFDWICITHSYIRSEVGEAHLRGIWYM